MVLSSFLNLCVLAMTRTAASVSGWSLYCRYLGALICRLIALIQLVRALSRLSRVTSTDSASGPVFYAGRSRMTHQLKKAAVEYECLGHPDTTSTSTVLDNKASGGVKGLRPSSSLWWVHKEAGSLRRWTGCTGLLLGCIVMNSLGYLWLFRHHFYDTKCEDEKIVRLCIGS